MKSSLHPVGWYRDGNRTNTTPCADSTGSVRGHSDHVEAGPISVADAIAIAKQMAEALEAGHEAGVIHRDLKPANIKLKLFLRMASVFSSTVKIANPSGEAS